MKYLLKLNFVVGMAFSMSNCCARGRGKGNHGIETFF